MKLKTCLGLLILILGLQSTAVFANAQQYVLIDQPNNMGMIKILLQKDVDAANLEVSGGYKLFDPKTKARISKSSVKKQYLLRPTLDGLAWGESYPGTYQLSLVPNQPNGFFLVDGIQYAGNLYVYQIGNTMSLVNEVPVEDYIKSKLNLIINEKMDSEVLAALAIIERTQAYYQALKSQNKFWHLDAQDIQYQGKSVCGRDNGVDRAVELTHHLVMKSKTYGIQEGLFHATYTQNCAGKTAPFHLIFRQEGHSFKKAVEVPLAQVARDSSHWNCKILVDDLAEKLGWEGVTSYEVYKDKESGKVFGLKVESKNESKEFDFQQMQTLLGEKKLKSSDFNLINDGNVFIFDGYGEGSGVGACLYSASEMAKRGQNAGEILAAFFPNTHIAFMDIRK